MSEPTGALSPEDSARVAALAADLAREGRTAELLEFLEHGVPVDLADGDGNTLLMLASYHGHAETVAALIGRGADVDARNGRDQSPVAGALFKGEKAVVQALVAAGADLDAGTPSARQAAEMFGTQALLGVEPDGER
ncbi:ankyrin repeat domain-containing protein [Janibacter sp. G1551]|uniref:ankyrin repeat domain-containing protein n=1 Tax=Janibacter sp. G1551 TaxID=3420440 RepID=UPI003CFDFDD6